LSFICTLPDWTVDGLVAGALGFVVGAMTVAFAAASAERTPFEIPPGYFWTCSSHNGVPALDGELGGPLAPARLETANVVAPPASASAAKAPPFLAMLTSHLSETSVRAAADR
jgi:hypothetical protein